MLALTRHRSLFGEMLRRRRLAKRLSQLELAMLASSSPRHVSFVETGRSRPGRELVERLLDALGVPDMSRSEWLVAAGFPSTTAMHAWAPWLLTRHVALPALVVGSSLELFECNERARLLLPGIEHCGTVPEAFATEQIRRLLLNAEEVLAGWQERLDNRIASVRMAMQVSNRRVQLRTESTPLSDGSRLEILYAADPDSEAFLFELVA